VSFRDLAGESYESVWTIDPLLFEGARIEQSKDVNDLVSAVQRISDGITGRDGHRKAAGEQRGSAR
jgi:hypothetical protein